ncbi:MAG TPA: hypothetical protein VFU11_10240 [Solirubrobacterales bacterium]|nr:hypothetical protein [Solirubrobacterales bacterium]
MPDEINPTGRRELDTDKSVLLFLTESGGPSEVALVADIERQFEDANEVDDALGRLERAGLVHRFDDRRLVLATRPAIVAGEIYDHAF